MDKHTAARDSQVPAPRIPASKIPAGMEPGRGSSQVPTTFAEFGEQVFDCRLDDARRQGPVRDQLSAHLDTSQPIDPSDPALTRLLEQVVADRIPGWRFGWDRAVKRAGATRPSSNDPRITVSKPIFSQPSASWDDLAQTLTHEIAHAIAGPKHGHDHLWRHTITTLGGRPDRCHTMASPPGAWTGTCPNGHTHTRHRRPKTGGQYSCGQCSTRFNSRFLITWTHTSETTAAAAG